MGLEDSSGSSMVSIGNCMGGVSIGSSMVVSMSSNNGSSMSSNNGGSMSSNDGGSNSADGDSGLVYADGVLVNDGSLHNMLDGVDGVGLGDRVGLFDLNGVRLGYMSVNNDFPFDRNGNSDGDGDLVFVHLKLGFNAGHLGGDSGVGADGSGDSLDSDGIGRGGSLVGGCGRDGSIGDRSSGDGRGSNGDSGLGGLWLTSDISVGGGLADRLLLGVGVSGLNSLGTNLDLTVTDNFVVGLMNSGSSMDMFLNTVSYNSRGGSIGSMSQGGGSMNQRCGSVVTTGGCLAKSHQH